MNSDERFLLRRMEAMEGRLLNKIDELMAFKNKALGILVAISFVSGGLGSIVLKIIANHL